MPHHTTLSGGYVVRSLHYRGVDSRVPSYRTFYRQVQQVIEHLRDNKHIRRAAHPTINAWRCTVDGIMHNDNDDDGETAAGSRLAHLLQILVGVI